MNHLNIQPNNHFEDTTCYELALFDVARYDIEVIKICNYDGTIYHEPVHNLIHLDPQTPFLNVYEQDIQTTLRIV